MIDHVIVLHHQVRQIVGEVAFGLLQSPSFTRRSLEELAKQKRPDRLLRVATCLANKERRVYR